MAKTPEEIREYYRNYRREYRKKNPDYVRDYYAANKLKLRENQKRYDATEKGKAAKRRARSKRLFQLYGITIEQYEKMEAAQNCCCAICGEAFERYALRVDHNHKTGKVRGLLCHACNAAIGLLKENTSSMKAAIFYVQR